MTMSKLDPREREFVALGAAVASNCLPCIEYHTLAARKAGITDGQIREAVKLADTVRQVPARQVLAKAQSLLETAPEGCGDASPDCACR
jgi:4-carboxymuconolactone decarboxylase